MPIEQTCRASATNHYITTAIPYVNAAPHIGFALEVVQADALARFYRLQGCSVRLQAGTDENSVKNVQAAEAAGIPVTELVEQNAARFIALRTSLDLSYDDFIRTSADERHRCGVGRLWKACFDKGDIYKRVYSGLYCNGCEQFYKPGDLDEGRCPEHGTKPELIEEENWFFRLSRYAGTLRDLYAHGEIEIIPETRRREVLSWIDGGLEDFSISRSATRARGWGIPVPGDPDQVIYVWFDALGNYITALGYGSDDDNLSRWWTQAASREHVIGKGITRFHAVYWPAILLSAGLPVPTRILVHGYVTAEGRKIGKSIGNAVDPVPLAEELGSDALRYFLLRHIRSTGDGDFSHARFRQAYESELAGQLGNLVHRVLSMIERYCDGTTPAPPQGFVEADRLLRTAKHLPGNVAVHLRAFTFDRALDAIWTLVADANRYVTEEAPWDLAKAATSCDREAASASAAKLHGTLFSLSASLFTIAKCIAPLLPEASRKLFQKLGETDRHCDHAVAGRRIEVGMPLFPKA
ncbi:methionine--tRNA ligase [Methylocapsa aurea]|uniref:methionine--tRNA ligase n=1 Tax=Methylocapsa aurea TaxID=663610 RepID=UPI000A036FD9|nr:class I tRNA ligase family protein [Methylocapsa aurea]